MFDVWNVVKTNGFVHESVYNQCFYYNQCILNGIITTYDAMHLLCAWDHRKLEWSCLEQEIDTSERSGGTFRFVRGKVSGLQKYHFGTPSVQGVNEGEPNQPDQHDTQVREHRQDQDDTEDEQDKEGQHSKGK